MEKPERILQSDANQTVILLVDDEPVMLNVLRIILERLGYFILTAGDGEEALHLSRSFPGTIHLLLSDIRMPRMNGLQLRKKVLEERPDTKVLLMSAYVEEPQRQAFLRKPFTPDVLRAAVRQVLTPFAAKAHTGD
jgi:CheY-like chemotaxis protein